MQIAHVPLNRSARDLTDSRHEREMLSTDALIGEREGGNGCSCPGEWRVLLGSGGGGLLRPLRRLIIFRWVRSPPGMPATAPLGAWTSMVMRDNLGRWSN